MRKNSLLACVILFAVTATTGASDRYKGFKGEYSIYAGELGEQLAPTSRDRKVSFLISGQVAREIFQAMGPDEKQACAAAPGDRSRSRKNLWCTYSRADGYTCYFGFDLRTGNSIPGGIC